MKYFRFTIIIFYFSYIWSSLFVLNAEKCNIFEPKYGNVKKKIMLPIVKMRMFDIHKDIWSLGFPFIL